MLAHKEKKVYALARQALVSSGDILLKRFAKFDHGEDLQQYGQRAYEESERTMLEILHNIYKGHGYRSPRMKEEGVRTAPVWKLNPLDGVSNFSHHIPLFGCSLTLEKDGKTVMAMVYLPVTREFYQAFMDGSVTLNNKRLESLGQRRKDVAQLYVTYCHSREQEDLKKAHDYLGRIQHKVREMNKITCASLGISLLIRGVYDAFIAPGLTPFSYQAAAFMATRLGAEMKVTKDGTVMLFSPGVEATLKNAIVKEEMK